MNNANVYFMYIMPKNFIILFQVKLCLVDRIKYHNSIQIYKEGKDVINITVIINIVS